MDSPQQYGSIAQIASWQSRISHPGPSCGEQQSPPGVLVVVWVGVLEGDAVRVEVAVLLGVAVTVRVGVPVGVAVAVRVGVPVGV